MPITRADQLPPPRPRSLKIGPTAVGDDWTVVPWSLWRATKLTLTVGANPILVQLSRDNPPDPPTWDDPVQLDVGPWSHSGPFGYVRLRNATPGATATVFGSAYSE